MKLNLTSATAALKMVKSGIARFPSNSCRVLLLVTAVCMHAGAWPAASGSRPSPHRKSQNTAEPDDPMRLRLRVLDSARSSDSTAAIADASRSVVALALRNIGQLQMAQGKTLRAIEIYRRSIDFENASATHVELARAYLKSNHPDQALSQVTNVLLDEPQNALAWRVQGQVWLWKGNYEEAIKSLRKSAELRPSAEANQFLRTARVQAGKPPNGQGGAEAGVLVGLVPKLAGTPAEWQARQLGLRKILGSALNDLGTAEAHQEQFQLALAHFHEAEQWQANTPGLMRNIGMAAIRTGDYHEAARALQRVVAANKNDTIARSMLGMALFNTNSYNEAARTLAPLGDSALERPELAYAWAESLVKLNRYEEAAALLSKLEEKTLDASTTVLVAQAWSEMGNYPRSVAACHRALQTDPKLAQAHNIAGLALIHEDRPAEAAGEFRAQLQQNPGDSNAEYHLAFVLLQLSQDQEAVQHLKNVLARAPNHADANYELGKWLLNAGKTAEAIPYLEAAARLKPGLDAVHYKLQSAYRSVGRTTDADREAGIYRAMKARSRNITLPPPRPAPGGSPPPQ